jgi:hypothetical protein
MLSLAKIPSEAKYAWFNNSTVVFGSSLYIDGLENGMKANLSVPVYRAHFFRLFF